MATAPNNAIKISEPRSKSILTTLFTEHPS
jgi:hypothetical protein